MELQTYIDETCDYIKQFKEHKLYVRSYSQLNLCIVKCYHNRTYDYDMYPWIKYCRGVVIDTKTNNEKLNSLIKSHVQKCISWCTKYNVLFNSHLCNTPQHNVFMFKSP